MVEINADAANDLGVEKEQLAELVNPVPDGFYMGEFGGLVLNEESKGYVHRSKSGGKKIMANFRIFRHENPAYTGRFIPTLHVSVTQKLFAQIDKALDLMTGSGIDPEKVENALKKIVRLKLEVDEYEGVKRNKVAGVFPYVEKKGE